MKLPTICFVNRSPPGRLGVFMDVFPEHPHEPMFVCFHTTTLAKEFFEGADMRKTLKSSAHLGPWQIERLRVEVWAKMAKDFCLLHNVQRIAFLRLIEEENLVVAEYYPIVNFLGLDCKSTVAEVVASLQAYVKELQG
jgi:hypothetical protein